MYARNVRSDARWSRATLPEFSSRNSTQFRTWRNEPDKRGWCCLHCRFGGSGFVSPFSLVATIVGNRDSAEKDRLKVGGGEHDGLV